MTFRPFPFGRYKSGVAHKQLLLFPKYNLIPNILCFIHMLAVILWNDPLFHLETFDQQICLEIDTRVLHYASILFLSHAFYKALYLFIFLSPFLLPFGNHQVFLYIYIGLFVCFRFHISKTYGNHTEFVFHCLTYFT